MLVNAANIIGIFILFSFSTANAKCAKVSATQMISESKAVFKGIVKNVTTVNGSSGTKLHSFSIQPIFSYKGDIKENLLNVSYQLENQKPELTTFKEGAVSTFYIMKLDGDKATIQNSSCVPEFSDKEMAEALVELKKSK